MISVASLFDSVNKLRDSVAYTKNMPEFVNYGISEFVTACH